MYCRRISYCSLSCSRRLSSHSPGAAASSPSTARTPGQQKASGVSHPPPHRGHPLGSPPPRPQAVLTQDGRVARLHVDGGRRRSPPTPAAPTWPGLAGSLRGWGVRGGGARDGCRPRALGCSPVAPGGCPLPWMGGQSPSPAIPAGFSSPAGCGEAAGPGAITGCRQGRAPGGVRDPPLLHCKRGSGGREPRLQPQGRRVPGLQPPREGTHSGPGGPRDRDGPTCAPGGPRGLRVAVGVCAPFRTGLPGLPPAPPPGDFQAGGGGGRGPGPAPLSQQ